MSVHLDQPSFDATAPLTIAARARRVFDDNHAIQLATLGGAWSPWILGAYFTRAPAPLFGGPTLRADLADLDLVLMVERHGKTFANLQADPRIALAVSKNDATQDFVQGSGRAVVLPGDAEAAVVAALVDKMPWFRLYTPCVPVRLELQTLFVTSFELGWMPAKRLTVREGSSLSS